MVRFRSLHHPTRLIGAQDPKGFKWWREQAGDSLVRGRHRIRTLLWARGRGRPIWEAREPLRGSRGQTSTGLRRTLSHTFRFIKHQFHRWSFKFAGRDIERWQVQVSRLQQPRGCMRVWLLVVSRHCWMTVWLLVGSRGWSINLNFTWSTSSVHRLMTIGRLEGWGARYGTRSLMFEILERSPNTYSSTFSRKFSMGYIQFRKKKKNPRQTACLTFSDRSSKTLTFWQACGRVAVVWGLRPRRGEGAVGWGFERSLEFLERCHGEVQRSRSLQTVHLMSSSSKLKGSQSRELRTYSDLKLGFQKKISRVWRWECDGFCRRVW